MEGSPSEIDTVELIKDIRDIDEDIKMHDFHLWSISVGKFALTAHIATKNPNEILQKVT